MLQGAVLLFYQLFLSLAFTKQRNTVYQYGCDSQSANAIRRIRDNIQQGRPIFLHNPLTYLIVLGAQF